MPEINVALVPPSLSSAFSKEKEANDDGIKTMKLYSHVERIQREVERRGMLNSDSIDPIALSEIDCMHYEGNDAIDDVVKAMRLDSSRKEAKVAIRNIRRDGVDSIKKMEKAGDLGKDQALDGQDEIQKMTDKHTKMVDDAVSKKEKEVSTL